MPSRTSPTTSALLSGGIAAISFLKGAANSRVASQHSSGGPGHENMTRSFFVLTSQKPAAESAFASLLSSAKRKMWGASGGGGGIFTRFRNGPRLTRNIGFSSSEPNTAKQTRPPGFNTQRISASAFGMSGKNMMPKRQVTRSNSPSENGRCSASATRNSMLE